MTDNVSPFVPRCYKLYIGGDGRSCLERFGFGPNGVSTVLQTTWLNRGQTATILGYLQTIEEEARALFPKT